MERSSTLFTFASIPALVPGIMGIRALWDPRTALAELGFMPPVISTLITPQDALVARNNPKPIRNIRAEAMMRLYGTRGIQITIVSLTCIRFGDRDTIFWSLVASISASLMNSWIMYPILGAGNAWAHGVLAVPLITLAGLVRGWW